MTEAFAFLDPLNLLPGVRAGWVERIPGLAIRGDRDQAMNSLRPHHQQAVIGFGGPSAECWRAQQIHGTAVARVPGAPQISAADGLPIVPEVDGLVTCKPGVVLAIYAADCGVIWLADRQTGAIGLLHSGKKGTAGNILQTALDLMAAEWGSQPQDITAVLSPCIRPPDYDLDFASEIATQAQRAGLARFHDCGLNTAADLKRFYSYRREQGRTGRMLALLVRDFLP